MGADDGWDVDDGRIGQVESDRERIERLEAENARLREALDWYGAANNYREMPEAMPDGTVCYVSAIELDGGERARDALRRDEV